MSLTVAVTANGQPALAYYSLDADTRIYRPAAIDVLSFDRTR